MVSHPTTVRQRTRIDRALADVAPSEQVEILNEELIPRLTPASIAWVFALADIADRNDLELSVVRRATADLAQVARAKGQRMPSDEDWQRCGNTTNPTAARRTLAYVHGHRLRLDLKFQELNTIAPKWLVALPNDAMLHSLYAFAALGRRAGRAARLLERVTTLPDYDRSCRLVCLHGLHYATHLPDQTDRILALSEQMINKGEGEADVHYWRAYALRRQGQFEEALASIDKAIAELPVGRNEAHEAYAREREIITGTQLLSEQLETYTDQLQGLSRHHQDQLAAQFSQHRDQANEQFRLHRELQQQLFRQHRDELRGEADQHASAARRIVSDSLLGIVEILALFAVLVSFLVALVALAVRADDVWQSLAMVALMVLGAGGIFSVMRSVARLDRNRGRRSRSPVRRLGEWLGFTEAPPEPVGNGSSPTSVKTG